jgi:hypothetical protein
VRDGTLFKAPPGAGGRRIFKICGHRLFPDRLFQKKKDEVSMFYPFSRLRDINHDIVYYDV